MEKREYEKREYIGVYIAVIGGLGLGLVIGSDFSGRYTTIFGAILVIISVLTMVVLSRKGKI